MYNKFDIAMDRILGKFSSPIKCISIGNKGDYVIVLHGLMRTAACMSGIEKALDNAGYQVVNIGYPANKFSIDILVEHFLDRLIKTYCVDKTKKIHFVAHSLGCILIRRYLQQHGLLQLGRVVMLAPPNNGSKMADFFKNNIIFKYICGPALQQLSADPDSFVNSIPKTPHYELGIIDGTKSINPFSYFVLKGKNDGIVTIKETYLPDATTITVPYSHFFMPFHKKTIKYVVSFIARGTFR